MKLALSTLRCTVSVEGGTIPRPPYLRITIEDTTETDGPAVVYANLVVLLTPIERSLSKWEAVLSHSVAAGLSVSAKLCQDVSGPLGPSDFVSVAAVPAVGAGARLVLWPTAR